MIYIKKLKKKGLLLYQKDKHKFYKIQFKNKESQKMMKTKN